MSSSFTYTLTNARSFPSSVNRCFFRSGCCAVRFRRPSATVLPDTSSAAFFSAYCRSGVGIWIFISYLMDAGKSLIVSDCSHARLIYTSRAKRASPYFRDTEGGEEDALVASRPAATSPALQRWGPGG